MRTSRTSRLSFLLLPAAILCLTACGEEAAQEDLGAAHLIGPPMHRSTAVALPGESHGMNIRAQGPCRLTLYIEGTDDVQQGFPARELAAGESVRLWWEPELIAGERVLTSAPEDAVAEGRTIGIVVRINVGYEDSAARASGPTLFTRTAEPTQAVRHYRAPIQAEEIPLDERLELCTFAVGDLDAGTVAIRPRYGGNIVTPRADEVRSPAQLRVLRLWLLVERLD